MQPTPPVTVTSFGMIALVLLVLVVIIGGFLAIHRFFGKTGLAVAGLLGLGGLFALMSAGVKVVKRDEAFVSFPVTATITPSGQADSNSTISISPEGPATLEPAISAGPAPSKIQYITGHSAPIEIQELPTWRKNSIHEGSLESGYGKYVLTSQQFATVEEAEAELFQKLTTDVQSGFAYHHPSTIGWVPTHEDILVSGLIAEKVIETIPLKVGEHETTVQRVSWLIEFKPEANKALHARWYPIEAARRSMLILSLLAAASGVFGVSALALRRSRNQAAPRPPENQMA